MIELRTLGSLDLRGADGFELRPVLQQPKRLALLAYLAVAHPPRFFRRDTLLAMFWPELDGEHARAALRRALYFLRRSLGDGVILSRGDEEVGLSSQELTCDAAAFQRAVAEGRPADALALYKGPLLDGLYVSGAPEFERWLDETRAEIHSRAAAAAWTVAGRAEERGDARAAVEAARRAASLAPYDEGVHRRLLSLVDRVGDRAGALRAHEEFVRRLRVDYDLEPSPETLAIVASIKQRRLAPPPLAATAASEQGSPPNDAPAPAPMARSVIAVLPFVVRGNREYAYLAEGLVDLLSTTLDGAGDVRTVDPRALLSHIAREHEHANTDRAHFSPSEACGIAERFGAGAFVLGSVIEAGGRLRICATLYDATTRGTPAVVAVEVAGSGESGVFDLVDEIARRLLAGQSAEPGTRLSRLAALTTESLPALKAYLRGEGDFRAGRYLQALDSFQSATNEDPSFALAYYRLSSAAAGVANLDLAREASNRAAEHRHRLASHDRALLDAQRAWLRGAADEAEQHYSAIVDTYVDDMEAWFLLGDVQFHHNPRRGRSVTEAREAFERALQYDPDHVSSLVHLARVAALEGRNDDLDALVTRVLKLSPAGDRALSMRALRAYAIGNEIEKARVLTALGRARSLAVGIAFTDIVLYARDIDGAHRLAKVLSKLVRASEERALCHLVLAHLELASGRHRSARNELSAAANFDAAWALELQASFATLPFVDNTRADLVAVRDALMGWKDANSTAPRRNQVLAAHNEVHGVLRDYFIGLVSVRLGDERATADALRALEATNGDADRHRVALALARTVRASAAARGGDHAEALRLLDEPHEELWYQQSVTSPFMSRAFERYLRGELLAALGQDEEAIAWYGTLGESSPYEIIYLAPAHFRQAELHERRGDGVRAASHYARCSRLWKGCDGTFAAMRETASGKARALSAV
jgi:DNA-binding SARP family transcriptional activator/TolB-like protein/Tfp pilus assembly protein PilF